MWRRRWRPPSSNASASFEASLRLVEWAAADRPVLLVVDDAHQADRASMRLLAHLARRLGGLPVAIALACPDRPTAEMDVVADVAARSGVGVARVAVGPITPEAVAALAASLGLAGGGEVDRVVAAAEGNALLATESARALAAGETAALPPNLRAAVRVSAGRLSPPARRLLDLVAAAGAPAQRVGAGPAGRHRGRRDRRGGARRWPGHADRRTARLPTWPAPGGRRTSTWPTRYPLHAALAEAVDPAQSAEVAGHWERAGRPDRAASAWVEVAAYAQSVGALAEAADALTRALDSAPERGDLWLQLDEVYALLGRREESDRAWDAGRTRLPAAALPEAWCHRGRPAAQRELRPAAVLGRVPGGPTGLPAGGRGQRGRTGSGSGSTWGWPGTRPSPATRRGPSPRWPSSAT